jgi:hypothetical protein
MPVANLINKADLQSLIYSVNYKGIFLENNGVSTFISSVWGLTAIAAIVPIVSIVTIFLFKNRKLQVRLSFFNMVLMAGYYALLTIYLWFACLNLNTDWSLKIYTAFPLVNIILNTLAIRAIAKDEALVKSLNRLR